MKHTINATIELILPKNENAQKIKANLKHWLDLCYFNSNDELLINIIIKESGDDTMRWRVLSVSVSPLSLKYNYLRNHMLCAIDLFFTKGGHYALNSK